MPTLRHRLRFALACIAVGSISIAYYGLDAATSGPSSVPLTLAELMRLSLPLTVSWFAFSGTCMLSEAQSGLLGAFASASQFLGHAALVAGIPIWTYWYLDLVFGVV